MKKISSFYEKEDNFVSHGNDCDDPQRVGILGRACQIGKKVERSSLTNEAKCYELIQF
jgi:hypothetical protein